MTQTETRNIGYGVAASVAIHVLLLASMALWMNSKAFESRFTPPPAKVEEPSVTLVFADAIEEAEPLPKPEPEPTPATPVPPPSKSERYIRTTQNQDAANAPDKADFVSDRNTVASAKLEASPNGEAAMPTTEGVSFLTNELANRDYKDGQTKDDSAPSAPPTPPPSPLVQPPEQLAMRQPDPPPSTPPPTNMAKKTESNMEEMMKELDEQLANKAAEENPAIEIRRPKPVTAADMPPAEPTPSTAPPVESTPPTPPTPPTSPPVPRAIPMPEPIANTPKPQEDAFQPHTRTSSVKGTISNRGGMDAVNAAATPTGRYMRQVTSAIERKWHTLRNANKDFVEPGRLRIRFYVNRDGDTEDITILDNKANAVLTDFSLTAILKAEVPPIPKDLLPILEKERVEIEYDIVIY